MNLRALVGVAAVAVVAVAASAFENTFWYGNLNCTTKAKVVGERTEKSEKEEKLATGVQLTTTNTAFEMGPIAGSNLNGLIIKKNNTHYSVDQPTDEDDLADLTNWVKAKILAHLGLDVNLATLDMKGTFTLIKNFNQVKVNITVVWSGTVASGEDSGKGVSGTVKLKGVLPRD
jgi:hypothetical protein